ncbi:MAG: mannose-6-phosphate isomerase [Bacteroidetes bacterium]|nr:mannose-6-phosphate isomerase [Bacteroidota bacterium]
MNSLYPFKFKSIHKEKIWGGQKLKKYYQDIPEDMDKLGESWILSGVEGDQSEITNGFLEENELNELVEVYMGDLVGEKNFEKFGNEFPILVKFIDTNDWLSIQVHPDDELAKKRKIGNGKTEMWYILDAERNAQLISGFSKESNREEYLQKLESKELSGILNYESVNQGDVFYIPAGRVHAIGPGITLAEIQQTSDTTYRIYDWDRKDDKGEGRELHTDEALDAIDFGIEKSYKTAYRDKQNETINILKTPHFITNIMDLDRGIEKDYGYLDSFVIHVCVEGSYRLNFPGGNLNVAAGEAILLPATTTDIQIIPDHKTKVLEVYID